MSRPTHPTRRATLALAGAAIAARAPLAAPAVGKKVKLTYWNWADNPNHQKISTDAVAMFNKSQDLIEVEAQRQHGGAWRRATSSSWPSPPARRPT